MSVSKWEREKSAEGKRERKEERNLSCCTCKLYLKPNCVQRVNIRKLSLRVKRKEATYVCKVISKYLKRKKVCEPKEAIKVSERIGSYISV